MAATIRLALVLAAACAAPPRDAAIENRAPASAPESTPAACPDVAGAVELFRRADLCVALVNEDRGPMDRWPAVWTWSDGRWSERRLERLRGQHWSGAGEIGGEILAVTDNAVESPGWELIVMASRDGERWVERGRVRKAYYLATVSAVAARGGELAITVELDDDDGAGVTPGTYRYRSADGGRSWHSRRQ